MRIDDLQARFGLPGRLSFTRRTDGAELIEVTAGGGRALISIKGAHVMSFIPNGAADIFWMSPAAKIAGPEPIRGGIPVCWPWFANHATDPSKPAHGFARTALWTVRETGEAAGGGVRVKLAFETGPQHLQLWPHQARLIADIVIGEHLSISLTTYNTGAEAFQLTEALHAYFRVGDVGRAKIEGLDGTEYLDKVEHFARKRQAGPVAIAGEVDRVYVGTTAETAIVDPVLARRIDIAKSGSSSTVVWNAGPLRASRLPDIADAWPDYLCVETTNAGDDVVQLAPGASHTLTATYSVSPL